MLESSGYSSTNKTIFWGICGLGGTAIINQDSCLIPGHRDTEPQIVPKGVVIHVCLKTSEKSVNLKSASPE